MNEELQRLSEDESRKKNWKRWGPYLSERQWATVREDYSEQGDPWSYFPHDHARSRAYRWGEDGLLGITDRECRLCFALALWNGQDAILKERLFGLTGRKAITAKIAKSVTTTSTLLRPILTSRRFINTPREHSPTINSSKKAAGGASNFLSTS